MLTHLRSLLRPIHLLFPPLIHGSINPKMMPEDLPPVLVQAEVSGSGTGTTPARPCAKGLLLEAPERLRTQLGLATGDVVAERYQVHHKLGAGGMGEVYLAEDLLLHRNVTLKRLAGGNNLDSSGTERLLTEAKRATGITNPHIAQVFDVCRHQGELLLVMEYIPGLSLRALLHGPMPAERFFSLGIQLADAIQAAHAAGVLHCDIKPENVIVTEQDFVKVLDFGLAQIVSAPSRDQQTVSIVSGDSTLSGTPGYMAPEVLREAPPTEQSDIFALGIVLYEMAGGKNPYKGKTFADSVHLTLSHDIAPLDVKALHLPEELNRILLKMMMRAPNQRYATVRDLLVDLRACQQSLRVGNASTVRLPHVVTTSATNPVASPVHQRRHCRMPDRSCPRPVLHSFTLDQGRLRRTTRRRQPLPIAQHIQRGGGDSVSGRWRRQVLDRLRRRSARSTYLQPCARVAGAQSGGAGRQRSTGPCPHHG